MICALPRLEDCPSLTIKSLNSVIIGLFTKTSNAQYQFNPSALPQSIGALQKLEYINLWDVPLAVEPTELYDLPNLQVLCLNPADHYPTPRIIRKLKNTLQSRVDILTTDG